MVLFLVNKICFLGNESRSYRKLPIELFDDKFSQQHICLYSVSENNGNASSVGSTSKIRSEVSICFFHVVLEIKTGFKKIYISIYLINKYKCVIP